MEENSAKIRVRPQTKHLKPFKKGQSGNENGRPLGQRNYATIYREALQLLADKNATTPEKLEAEMIANGAMLARKGDYRFYKDVLDRIHGQATQKTEITGSVEVDIDIKEKENIKNLFNETDETTN